VLVHDFVVVPLPCLDLRDRLAAEGPALLARSVAAVSGDVDIQADAGGVIDGSGAFVVPIGWRAASLATVCDRIQGDLEFFAVDPATSHLQLLASYTPTGPGSPSRIEHARVERFSRAVLGALARQLQAGVVALPGHG
jgi:hypothetical protein